RNLYLSQMSQAHLAWKDGQVGRVLDLLESQTPERTAGHDFRGFEWFYLRRLCQAGHSVLVRQPRMFTGLACSPDGKIVAASSCTSLGKQGNRLEPELKLWDVVTGKEMHALKGHAGSSNSYSESLAFSPNSKRIAAFGSGGIHVWDAESGN